MDVKQFELFQATVQHAIDESKTEEGFYMGSWIRFPNPITVETVQVNDPRILAGEAVVTTGSCGTAGCLAGTAVILNGSDRFLVNNAADRQAAWILTEEGKGMPVGTRAKELLGLTHDEASRLFYMTGNTIEQIVRACERIADDHGHTLEVIM